MKKRRKINGYILIYKPKHPRAMKGKNWGGWVYEHIVVAEKSLGRPLKKNEEVHHLDEDRANNADQNLLVLTQRQHSKLHAWLNRGAPRVKIRERIGVNSKKSKSKRCLICDYPLKISSREQKYCSIECRRKGDKSKSKCPSKKKLRKLIKIKSWVSLGKKYGVSDNAVRKWARKYGLI